MLIKDAKYNDGQCFVGNGCVEHIKVHVDDKGVGNLWHYEARVIARLQEFQKAGVASLLYKCILYIFVLLLDFKIVCNDVVNSDG